MAIQRRKATDTVTGWTAEQIHSKIGGSLDAIRAALETFGPISNDDELATFQMALGVQPTAPQPQVQPQPSVEAEDVMLASLAEAEKSAFAAGVKAAATMADATSGLYGKVESKLTALRSDRDEQLSTQIAGRIFAVENQTLGKSFGMLMEYTANFNPYRGTKLEGLQSQPVDIAALMAGE